MNTEPQPRTVNSSPAQARGFLRGRPGSFLQAGAVPPGAPGGPCRGQEPRARTGFMSQGLVAWEEGTPGVLDRRGGSSQPGGGTTVKSAWQGRCWLLAGKAKPRPRCWHRRGRRRHPGVGQAPGGAEGCSGARGADGQAGSGRWLLPQSPNSRRNKQRAPHPLADPQGTWRTVM